MVSNVDTICNYDIVRCKDDLKASISIQNFQLI